MAIHPALLGAMNATLLESWEKAKLKLQEYATIELTLRNEIVDLMWNKEGTKSGSQTMLLAPSVKLEINRPLNYSVDGKALDPLENFCDKHGIQSIMTEGGLFRYKAECSVSFYNNTLPALEANMAPRYRNEFRRLVSEAITIKPGQAQIKLTRATMYRTKEE